MACPLCERASQQPLLASRGRVVAFPDAYPVSPGHALVVPRRHVVFLADLEPDELADLWLLGSELCRTLAGSLHADAFNLGINLGRAAGQTIAHLHLHVIPRYEGDVPDPRGGVRWILPQRAEYWNE